MVAGVAHVVPVPADVGESRVGAQELGAGRGGPADGGGDGDLAEVGVGHALQEGVPEGELLHRELVDVGVGHPDVGALGPDVADLDREVARRAPAGRSGSTAGGSPSPARGRREDALPEPGIRGETHRRDRGALGEHERGTHVVEGPLPRRLQERELGQGEGGGDPGLLDPDEAVGGAQDGARSRAARRIRGGDRGSGAWSFRAERLFTVAPRVVAAPALSRSKTAPWSSFSVDGKLKVKRSPALTVSREVTRQSSWAKYSCTRARGRSSCCWRSMVKFCTWPRRKLAKERPVPVRPGRSVPWLVKRKRPVGDGGWTTSRRLVAPVQAELEVHGGRAAARRRRSSWKTEVRESEKVLAGEPSCWKPSTVNVGRASSIGRVRGDPGHEARSAARPGTGRCAPPSAGCSPPAARSRRSSRRCARS